MTVRSIFDADMSRPVRIVRPRPDGMALSERALAKAMADEARTAPHMRRSRSFQEVGAAANLNAHHRKAVQVAADCGLPLGIRPGTMAARVYLHLRQHGPLTRAQIAEGLKVSWIEAHNAAERLVGRGHLASGGLRGPGRIFRVKK
jgi:CRP-like cAMP-binding protein